MDLARFSCKLMVPFFMAFLLSSCGFHLRGMMDMPVWLNDVAIVVEKGHRDLSPLLKKQLQAYHIRVTENPNQAHYVIVIEQDSERQHMTSVSSSSTPRQYQMTYTVRFRLQQVKGLEIIAPCNVVITRQLTINSDRILGSDDEEAILKKEMRQDAAVQILDRIENQAPKSL